ncbi:MAG: molybdopterin converting factor subunit 1 [Gammaproteobacteria bacterium]
MAVHVKYFASLRETIGRSNDEVSFTDISTVEDVWTQATQNLQRPDRLLVAVNQEYASFDKKVCDEDEIAFFPPVTGG